MLNFYLVSVQEVLPLNLFKEFEQSQVLFRRSLHLIQIEFILGEFSFNFEVSLNNLRHF